MGGQSLNNPVASAFRTGGVVLALAAFASMCIFIPRLILLLLPLAGVGLLWAVFQWPITALGAVLAFLPIDFMVIAMGKFIGLPYMTVLSVCNKEVPLLLLVAILWRRNGFKSAAPDWLLLGSLAVATVHTIFDGTVVGLWTDFNFVIPYFVGRVSVLTQEQEYVWARRAVWIIAVLAVLGLIEVFIVGEGPRTILYLAIGSETDNGGLTASFHGTAFTGLREASTTVGPNGFGVFCMIALILWWVYCRNPIPAGMVAIGLICSVTRSAWVGTAAVIPLLSSIMGQGKRLLLYATLAVSMFLALIPVLGLRDFLASNRAGQDESTEGHRDDIVSGVKFAADHPLGVGNRKLSPIALREDKNTRLFETTYPQLSSEYGIGELVLFTGFLFSALVYSWQLKSNLGTAAVGILVSLMIVMIVALPLTDRRLACWLLLPVGLAVRSSTGRKGLRTLEGAKCTL